MKRNKTKPVSIYALFFLGVFALTLTSCKKEMMNTSTDETLPQVTSDARASSVTLNEKIDVNIPVFIPCANGGAGETVVLSGNLHVLLSFTMNGNIVRGKYHYQPQGISGVGLITGDTYHATGVTQQEFKVSLVNGQAEESDVNNFRIIGQGPGNNYLIHDNFHVTINANGVLTTLKDHFTADCK